VVDTWVNKGTVLWKAMELRDEALTAFDKALEINPNFMAAVDSRISLEAEIKANQPGFFKRIFG
jgi:tetratricopeptide (TPR) repeat protein